MEQSQVHVKHTFLKEVFLGLLPIKAEGEKKPQAGSLEKRNSPGLLLYKLHF